MSPFELGKQRLSCTSYILAGMTCATCIRCFFAERSYIERLNISVYDLSSFIVRNVLVHSTSKNQ